MFMTTNDDNIYGLLFSMEEFAINDGPGIRTTIFLKGCPLRCAWCHNPEGISSQPQYIIKKGVRELCGYRVSAQELARQVLRNSEIFRLNGGGVTLTGGEPLRQPTFVIDFLRRIVPQIHTAIETSGYAAADVFDAVLPYLNLVLFDVKHMNNAQHRRYTGVGNSPILRNLGRLCAGDTDFIVRIPLIPGVNDTAENMKEVLAAIQGAPHLKRVELLRYNTFAGAKYAMIGEEYAPPFDVHLSPQVHDVFAEAGIETLVL